MFGFSLAGILRFMICFVLVHAMLFALMYFYLGKMAVTAKKNLAKKESPCDE
jgi:hypothetical protein